MNQRRTWLPRLRTGALTSIKYRLVVLFFSITAGAILVLYFYVVPQLESNLISQKVDDLKRDATRYSKPLQQAIGRDVTARELDRFTRGIGEQSAAGVTLLGIPQDELESSSAGVSPPYVISDSRETSNKLEPASGAVLEAARSGKVITTTESEGGQRLAQAAKPLFYRGEAPWVVVFSEPLGDVADNVALIQRQIVIAGVIALVVALVSGYYASSALSRRVKRLERAAGEVAAGNFSKPIPVDSEDELGQLARAFNEMQRRLARLDEARKEFIANASHELRTPIFSLGGFVELLQDEELDEQTRSEFLSTMHEQVDRLQKLTTDLLDLSRLDAGSLELELEPISLRMLADQIATEFTAAAAGRGARITVTGEEAGAGMEVECDPQRVVQILRILVDNALTHTGAGASIEIAARRSNSSTDGLPTGELTVTDNGGGIHRLQLPHLFDRFYTGDTAHGSGLGLAIARELAERMHGKLDVTSIPGQTTFKLSLPAAREPSPPDGAGPDALTETGPAAAGAKPT